MKKKLPKELLQRLAQAPEEVAREWFSNLPPEEKPEAERLLQALKITIKKE